MRIILAVAVVAILSVALFACGEQTETSVLPDPAKPGTAGLSYALATDGAGEKYAFVKGYEGTSAKIEVAERAGDAPVKAFSGDVFKNKDFIEEIVFPSTVEEFPDYAFENCLSLRSVTASGVEKVGTEAFKATAFMEELPDGAVYFNDVLCDYKIEENRISGVSLLTVRDGTVSVTAAVLQKLAYLADISIANDFPLVEGMFDNIRTLQKITVRTDGSGTLTSQDGILYDGSTLIKYPEGKSNISFTLPATVKAIAKKGMSKLSISNLSFAGIVDEISEEAFADSSLSYMSYGTDGGFRNVGRAAFKGTKFTSITFPSTMETLGEDNFAYSSLKTIKFPENGNLRTIGARAFKGSAEFTGTDANGNLVLPSTVEEIGESAFYGCKKLVSVDVGEGLRILEGAAFYGLPDLKTARLSPVLEEIGGNAFHGAAKLSEINFPYTLREIGNSAFKNCSSINSVSFGRDSEPDYSKAKLAYIGISAFENCSSLTEFTAPHSLEKIGSAAFRNSGLTSVTVLRNKSLGITKLGLYNLDGTRVNEIIVPMNSVREYKNATGWSFAEGSIFAAEPATGSVTVFFDAGGKGTIIEKTALAGALVINQSDINIEIPIVSTVETTESVNADGKKVITVKTTYSRDYVAGWYVSANFAEGSEVYFDDSGNYRPDVPENSYITLYAKWQTEVWDTVTEEVVDA